MATDLLNEIVFMAKDYPISVDLKKRNLRVNNQFWILEGEITEHAPTTILYSGQDEDKPAIERLEDLYKIYKYSYPTEKESKRKNNYFQALPADKLEDMDLVYGVSRYIARVVLETATLLFVLSGELKWDESWGSWYYKGKDPGFILLREWIE